MRFQVRSRRAGFTLTELLVVILIIALIAAVSLGTYVGLSRRGHVTATEALIRDLYSSLQERLESFKAETIAPSAAQITAADPASPGTSAHPQRSQVYHRALVLARLEAMRADFPQQFTDFMRPTDITTVGGNTFTGQASATAARPVRTAIYQEYLRRTNHHSDATKRPQVSQSEPFDTTFSYSSVPLNHQPHTESSECLYLLLTVKTDGATFNISDIPERFIRDTDEDGLMEFVDSWGQPLQFYRWPTDYLAYLLDISDQLPEALQRLQANSQLDASVDGTASSNLDPEGLLTDTTWFGPTSGPPNPKRVAFESGGYFRLHQAYPANPEKPDLSATIDANGVHTARQNARRAYPLVSLIVSAGADQKHGLMVPDADQNGIQDRAPMPDELHFRGARLSDENLQLDVAADNVLSLQLTETQQ